MSILFSGMICNFTLVFSFSKEYIFYTEYGCVFTPVFVRFVKKEAKRFPNCLHLPRRMPSDFRRLL